MNLRSRCIRLASTLPVGSSERRALLEVLKSAGRPIGKATYKGKVYNLLFLGPTRYGERAQLQFLDGTKDFWVDAHLVSQVNSRGPSRAETDNIIQREPDRGGPKASPKQIAYALSLIERLGRFGWHDSDMGQAGGRPPTRSDLESMSSREVSEIIESLKSEF